jgi:hypothetical protein
MMSSLKAVWNDFVSQKIVSGVIPIFNEVDLELKDIKLKFLFWKYFNEYPTHTLNEQPLLEKSPKEEDESFIKKRYVKFYPFTKNAIYKAKQNVREDGIDEETVIFCPLNPEEIMQFHCMLFFRSKGYIVIQELTLPDGGSPDLTCWKTPLLRKLRENDLLNCGASILELSGIKIFGKIMLKHSDEKTNFLKSIVVEAQDEKTWGEGISQLIYQRAPNKGSYTSEGYFDEAYIAIPFKRIEDEDRVGIFSFDEKGLYFKPCYKRYSKEGSKQSIINQIDRLIKLYLLKNFTFDEICNLINIKGKTLAQVLNEIEKIPDEKILDLLDEMVQ